MGEFFDRQIQGFDSLPDLLTPGFLKSGGSEEDAIGHPAAVGGIRLISQLIGQLIGQGSSKLSDAFSHSFSVMNWVFSNQVGKPSSS